MEKRFCHQLSDRSTLGLWLLRSQGQPELSKLLPKLYLKSDVSVGLIINQTFHQSPPSGPPAEDEVLHEAPLGDGWVPVAHGVQGVLGGAVGVVYLLYNILCYIL